MAHCRQKAPGLRRYVQSCALPQGYAKGELLFDAIGEMWFDSAEAYDRYLHSPEFAAAREDESLFLDRSRTVVMPVDVHVIKDGASPTMQSRISSSSTGGLAWRSNRSALIGAMSMGRLPPPFRCSTATSRTTWP